MIWLKGILRDREVNLKLFDLNHGGKLAVSGNVDKLCLTVH